MEFDNSKQEFENTPVFLAVLSRAAIMFLFVFKLALIND